MKKLFSVVLALCLACSIFALPASAVGFDPSGTYDVQAPAAYIVNLDTNLIMYQKNAREPLPAASLTKLMTVTMMLDFHGDELDTMTGTMTMGIQDYLYGKNASHADILRGESHTFRSLLYAMMLPSGNEAAMMAAAAMAGGSQTNFVYMMNAKAKEIGCKGTQFYDACGLDPRNVTTAEDMYLILRHLLEYDVFREVCKAPTFDMPVPADPGADRHNAPYTIWTTDLLIDEKRGAEFYREYAQGGKTGSLEDWQNFAGWHVENGETYISVVLNSPKTCDAIGSQYTVEGGRDKRRPALYETAMLMDWVYGNFAIQPALDIDEPLTEVKVKYSTDTDTLMLYPADDMKTILPKGTDGSVTQKTFTLPEDVAAPIKQGDVVGTVSLTLSGEVIGTVDLLAGKDVERNSVLFVIEKIGEFFGSLYFRVVLILSAIAVAGYVILFFMTSHKNRGRQIRRRR